MKTNRKTPKYQADRFTCTVCGRTKRTATALDGVKCRQTENCAGHYVREAK